MFGLTIEFIKSDNNNVLREVGYAIGFTLDIANEYSVKDPDSEDNQFYQVISYILSSNIIPDMINALFIDNSEVQRIFLYTLQLISDYGSREELEKAFDLTILDVILKILNEKNSPNIVIVKSLYVLYNLLKVSDILTDLFNKEVTIDSLFNLIKDNKTEEIRLYVFEIFSQFFNSNKKRVVYSNLIEGDLFKYLLTESKENDNKLIIVKLNLIEDLLDYESYNNLDNNNNQDNDNTFLYRIEHDWFKELKALQNTKFEEVYRKAERIIQRHFLKLDSSFN